MIYNNAVDQIKGLKPDPHVSFRLAQVSSLSNGRAYVQFYGESSASSKLYPYIEGYKPTVGDNVLLAEQGSTYIIIGKISKVDIVNNYNLTKAVADTLYEPIGSSGETDHVTSGSFSITLTGTNGNEFTPSQNDRVTLGTTSSKFSAVHATLLTGHWGYNSSRYLEWTSNTDVVPTTNNNINLGSSSYKFSNFYASNVHASKLFGQWNYDDSKYISLSISGNYTQMNPYSTNMVDMGTSSKQYRNVYAKQFYQNGTAISTSDRRKKTNIKDIAKKYIDFFKRLKPRSFRFKDGESGRTHTGFIAQEVEEAAAESGINNKDLAFICIDEEGNYGLRYDELIAIQTQVIQDLMARVERLENIVKERT